MIDIEKLCKHIIIIIDDGKIIYDDSLERLQEKGELTEIVKQIFIGGEGKRDEINKI